MLTITIRPANHWMPAPGPQPLRNNMKTLTIGQALAYGREMLTSSDSPALDARLLLEHALQAEHSTLIAHADRHLTTDQLQTYRFLVERAARREPIPYLTGWAPFFGMEFMVSPAVLIPRPETELLVDAALDWTRGRSRLLIADVGTGSGCIAIALARHLPDAQITAVDLSPDALAIARANAANHGLQEQITFCQGHLLEPVNGRPDLIVANLPYVTDHEWTSLDDGVKWYEPAIALQGGSDGLALIRQLLDQAASRLAPGGAIFLEIGWQQGSEAGQLAQDYFTQARVEIHADFAGHDRIVVITT